MSRWVFLIAFCFFAGLAQAHSVGFMQADIFPHSERALKAFIWYPSDDKTPVSRIAENVAFIGTDVIKNASPKKGYFPVVLLSHGYRGNWRNLNWLANDLVKDGYLVAAVNHPGTTTLDHDAMQAAQWWQRPRDMSRLLDWLLDNPLWGPIADKNRIAAIGHSLGGWTVMNLAGARFSTQQFMKACQIKQNPRVCGLASELGVDRSQPDTPKKSLWDKRVHAVVSLDLGMARGFTVNSLRELPIPVLILAAGIDIGDLPQQEESGFLAHYIPERRRQYLVYPNAAHFSFMQLCKPGAVALLDEESPGDGVVCKDGQFPRVLLHQKMYAAIHTFLDDHL